MSTYIIGRDERSGREGSIPEWANIHPRKQTVEFSVRKFKEEIHPGHGIIKYDNGKVAQLISLKRYPSKKAVEEMLKEAEGQDYRVTLITGCKAGKLEILYKEETVCTH